MPLAFALLAGALATLNPCGFVLLPAFLSYSVGIDAGESHLLPARPGSCAARPLACW
jgi:cytochrome c biogenesis protein CcdA